MKLAKVPLTVSEGRLRAIQAMPYMRDIVLSLIMVERPGLGTLAVDKWGRCYYDPAWLDAHSTADAAFVFLHESFHVFLKHCERLLNTEPVMANVAKDLAVNSMLVSSGVPACKEGCFPEDFGFPDNRTTEEYYEMLEKMPKQEEPRGGSGKGDGKGKPGEGKGEGKGDPSTEPGKPCPGKPPDKSKGEGGSGQDGEQKPWECGPPSDDQRIPGLDSFDLEEIIDGTARNIVKHQGSVPGNLKRIAKNIIDPPTDPFKLLETVARSATESAPGFGQYTYKRPSRRLLEGGAVLPHHRKPMPRPVVLVDTSGSMDHRDLGLALGAIQRGLRTFQSLTVVAGDTHIAAVSKVFKADQVQLAGGGGTNVGAMIEQACEQKPRPTCIVAITDGYTPYPSKPVNCPVVICLTQSSQKDRIPKWCRVVELNPKGE